MKRLFLRITVGLGVVLMTVPLALQASTGKQKTPSGDDLAGKVRHELVMLPWYGVFDILSFQVDNGKVTLAGDVTRPTLRSDAENVVKRIPGVTGVENTITVLPLSPFDDRVRVGVLRALYGYPTLQRYGMGSQPQIRIIVRNGNVTLEGVVDNQADKNVAGIRANGVFGVFKLTNNLRVAGNKS